MKSFLTFIAGIGLGVAISWVHHKNKYEEMVQEEVESLRDLKSKKNDSDKEPEESKEGILVAEEIYEEHLAQEKAKQIINYNGYSKSSDDIAEDKKPEPAVIPYIITPENFASEVGYDTDTFYIFEDNVIADDNNDKIENVKETFGLTVEEIRNQFGVYEEDSVYIRNEKIQTDYEILRELDTYEKRNGE